jgi:hypothetical protein
MHMSAEPSPLHDMTEGVMHSVAMTIMYPLIHYACMAFKRVLGYTEIIMKVKLKKSGYNIFQDIPFSCVLPTVRLITLHHSYGV